MTEKKKKNKEVQVNSPRQIMFHSEDKSILVCRIPLTQQRFEQIARAFRPHRRHVHGPIPSMSSERDTKPEPCENWDSWAVLWRNEKCGKRSAKWVPSK